MNNIAPSKTQYGIAEKDGCLYIAFKQKHSFSALLSFFFTLLMFFGVIITLIVQTFSARYLDSGSFETLIIFAVFLAIFTRATYKRYCQLFGSEMVVLDTNKIKIISTCLKREQVKAFDMKYIRNLRSDIKGGSNKKNLLEKIRRASGVILFDYGADTFSFGSNLTEPEMKDLVLRIKRHCPITDSDELDSIELSVDDNGDFIKPTDTTKSEEDMSLKDLLRH